MKKKRVMIITALLAAFSLLTITAYAATPTYEGYEAFKALANEKDMMKPNQENGTLSGSFTLIDNGKTIVNLDAKIKSEGFNQDGSGLVSFTSNGESKSLEFYSQSDQAYVYDLDSQSVYALDKTEIEDAHASNYKNMDRASDRKDGKMTSAQEELLDFVVGDLKDNFKLTKNSDGSETIAFEMTNGDMPILLNLMISAADGEKRGNIGQDAMDVPKELLAKYPLLGDMLDMKADLPEIVDNIELNKLAFQLTTMDDELISMDFALEVAGNDLDGNYHNLAISGDFGLSDQGTSSADTLNFEGKKVITVDPADFEALHNKDMERKMGARGRK